MLPISSTLDSLSFSLPLTTRSLLESPGDMSDPVSPYERPIRPLPKRRLRERLSPEAADSLRYPPVPSNVTPLFYPSYTIREDVVLAKVVESPHSVNRDREGNAERRDYVSRRIGDDVESEEEEASFQGRVYDRRTADPTGRSYRYVQKPDSKHLGPHGLPSATSSVDGYDSFENTNNKKKRKIPTPGENGAHLSTDAAGSTVGDEPLEDTQAGVVTYHTPANTSSQGLSGPGRGRYGRNRNGRSPLRTLSDSSGNWGNGRATKPRPQWAAQSESTGIISRSIASANAEKRPIQPAQGQENFSLLQQQASKKASPSTQFTFTCDSQVPGTVPWPGPTNPPPHQTSASRMSTHATQTSPGMAGNNGTMSSVGHANQDYTTTHHASNSHKQGPAGQPRKSRRRPGKEYLIAARQRRQQQEFRNFHHPPAPEEVWICEFCEYERIFGTPPEALIRQYEIKDRRVRKQEAERRRLLEKAKMKGRKGKKGNKAGPKAAATHDRQTQHHLDQRPPPVHQSHSQGTQSEEYYDDEYDEEYTQDEPPPPSPAGPAVAHHYEPHHLDPGKHSTAHTGGGGKRIVT